jgi:hypothetical protein
MDSLSTGSMQSWLIVASASLSPMIIEKDQETIRDVGLGCPVAVVPGVQ